MFGPRISNPLWGSVKEIALLVALAISILVLAWQSLQADTDEHWVTNELKKKDYKLSSHEKQGVYFCSVKEGPIATIEFRDGFVVISFSQDGPLSFVEQEIPKHLLQKLRYLEPGKFYRVLCVHSAFRDDWQQRYDANRQVYHTLLNIERIEKRGSPELARPREQISE
jgi:hypothetical protein